MATLFEMLPLHLLLNTYDSTQSMHNYRIRSLLHVMIQHNIDTLNIKKNNFERVYLKFIRINNY